MSQISSFLEAAGIALQALLIVLLLRGPFRRYPLLLAYCVSQLAAALTEIYIYRVLHDSGAYYSRVYWRDEVLLDLLLFLMVILLIYRALEGSPLRAGMGRLLTGVVIAVAIVPFVLLSARRFSTAWFDGTSQVLNFGAAIMNLVLWTALIATKKRDPLLLTVSAGLGVAVTGAAITFGLRRFTLPGGTPQHLANLFKTVTYLASILIWCWAFRPAAKKSAPPAALGSPTLPS